MPEIAVVLKEEAVLLAEFIVLLKDEQNQLVNGTIEALPALADKKRNLAEKLAHLKSRRLSLAAANPYPEAVQQDIAALRTMAEQALFLNNLNGKLIGDRLSTNRATLQVLMDAVKQATIYGPDGQTQIVGSGRPRGQA